MLPNTEAIMTKHFHLPPHMLISEDDAKFIIQSQLKLQTKF